MGVGYMRRPHTFLALTCHARPSARSMRNVLDPLLLIIANDFTDEHDLSQILRRLFLVLGGSPLVSPAPPSPRAHALSCSTQGEQKEARGRACASATPSEPMCMG